LVGRNMFLVETNAEVERDAVPECPCVLCIKGMVIAADFTLVVHTVADHVVAKCTLAGGPPRHSTSLGIEWNVRRAPRQTGQRTVEGKQDIIGEPVEPIADLEAVSTEEFG